MRCSSPFSSHYAADLRRRHCFSKLWTKWKRSNVTVANCCPQDNTKALECRLCRCLSLPEGRRAECERDTRTLNTRREGIHRDYKRDQYIATFVVSQDMSHHQGAAYAKLFRWVQRECASRLSRGQPEVEPMLQKAVAKLTKRHDADPSHTQHAKELVVQVDSTSTCALISELMTPRGQDVIYFITVLVCAGTSNGCDPALHRRPHSRRPTGWLR